MKRILSEKNFAGILFVLVLVAFSFAHEDSKKKDPFYQALKFEERYPSTSRTYQVSNETAPRAFTELKP